MNFPVPLLTLAIAIEDELAFSTLGDGWDLTEAAHVRHNPHISFFLVHYNIISMKMFLTFEFLKIVKNCVSEIFAL